MTQNIHFIVDENDIGTLRIDVPDAKVNTLSPTLLAELDKLLTETVATSKLKALVVTSGKAKTFIAGADIKEFTKIDTIEEAEKMAKTGQGVFNKLSKLPMPTIAVIDGACMGGGTELALACDFRVAVDAPETKIALPETQLGLIPAWGGTQRMPRLIGLMKAMEMILSGKAVNARKALKFGLVDAVFGRPFCLDGVDKFIQRVLSAGERKKIRSRRKKGGMMSVLLEKNPIGRYVLFRQAQNTLLKKTQGHYPAPLAALHVLKDTEGVSLEEGLDLEAKVIARLFDSPVTPNLIHLFFAQQEIKKNPGMLTPAEPKKIKNAAVLGAGAMGGGIAWLFTKGDIPVRMKDISWDAIAKGFKSAFKTYKTLQRIRKIKPDAANVKMNMISGTTDYAGFMDKDIIIEAIVEDMDIKKKVLADLENHIRPDTIVGSNTSSLSITEMATSMKHPERFVGIHFFNPVPRMPLVEIVPGEKTSPEAVATAVALMKKLKKTPIVVKDSPGFLVNRILLPYLNEAGWLLEEGIEFERIDNLMTKFGMPMGPFELLDNIGIDVACKVSGIFEEAFGERAKVPPVLFRVLEAGMLGVKSGGAFFKDKAPNKEMVKFLHKQGFKKTKRSNPEIVDRMVLAMVNEAGRCLEEGIVVGPDQVDMAMIMGTGFPPFRGGLLRYADNRGIGNVVTTLTELQQHRNERFAPCKLLVEMKEKQNNFGAKYSVGTDAPVKQPQGAA